MSDTMQCVDKKERQRQARIRWKANKEAKWIAENGPLPLCECGCGETVRMQDSGRIAKFASSKCHNDMKKVDTPWHIRREQQYVAEHGSKPLCACGCGEEVSMNKSGVFTTYLLNHYQMSDVHAAQSSESTRRKRERERASDDFILIEDFRRVLFRLKAEKGYTWDEIAKIVGLHKGAIRSLAHGKNRLSVSREWATWFLRCLAGLPFEPTEKQKQMMANDKRNNGSFDKAIYKIK